MSEQKTNRDDHGDFGPLPEDELDLLLREWHQINSERAASIHDQLMQQISESNGELIAVSGVKEDVEARRKPAKTTRPLMWRLIMNRYTTIAACLVLLALLIPTLMPTGTKATYAGDIAMVPEGGRLDALDNEGHILGPCALKHTDVDVDVSGFFTRVTVKQQYHNLYDHKIEAVYTFPLSERAAVDRMKMTIGDRVVIGEVHERNQARAIYEAARQQGYVASLLEQERPNIFTQSLANIEPNAEIAIEISYVELLESKDGTYSFDFPMVVGPRYIPGSPRTSPGDVPTGLTGRHGLILLAPATLTVKEAGDITRLGPLQTDKLEALLHAAVPIETPYAGWWNAGSSTNGDTSRNQGQPVMWYRFEAAYGNGAKEFGTLHADGTGQINGRWFYAPPKPIKANGTGFSSDTTQVPDASKITPQPAQPGTRAGHDISIKVTLDTGGPGIIDLKSALHQIVRTEASLREDGSPRKITAELRKEADIPNRDFVLTWRQTADTIQEATFAHTGKNGNFVTLILQPPARVEDVQAVPRELIFVLDTSGSMSGFPIEKAKEVMAKAIDALRPQDTFNLITFSGDEHILWDKPRPFTQANRQEAQNFLASRQGSGGTEMMKAIEAALVQPKVGTAIALMPDELANLPADGRVVFVRVQKSQMTAIIQDSVGPSTMELVLSDGQKVRVRMLHGGSFDSTAAESVEIIGRWVTENRQRLFIVHEVKQPGAAPIRICCFMTDGYVGNDMQIIDAVKKNAGTTRVFSFGIGNSVNRYLLDGMAKAGRGEVEYVLLNDGASEKAKRFAQRIQTPVLTDIQVQLSDGLQVTDMIPNQMPDLFDVKPLILHGRYTKPGTGTLTIRGQTGSGRYERTLPLDLPASQPQHDTIATLWARAKVEGLMNQDLAAAQQGNFPQELKNQVVSLGETFSIMTQFTSFVAVERARVTLGGQPQLVAIPIEMPHGVNYETVFGKETGYIKGFSSSDTFDWGGSVSASGTKTHGSAPVSVHDRFLSTITDSDGDSAQSLGFRGGMGGGGGKTQKDVAAANSQDKRRMLSQLDSAMYEMRSGVVESLSDQQKSDVAKYWAMKSATKANAGYASLDQSGAVAIPVQPAASPAPPPPMPQNQPARVPVGNLTIRGNTSDIDHEIASQLREDIVAIDGPSPEPMVIASPVSLPPNQPTGGPANNIGAGSKNLTFTLDISGHEDKFGIESPGVTEGLNVNGETLRALAAAVTNAEQEKLQAKVAYENLVGIDPSQVVDTRLQQKMDEKESEVRENQIKSAHTAFLNAMQAEMALRDRILEAQAQQTVTQPATSMNKRTIPFLCEQTALGIAELIKYGKLDEARKLADDLVKFDANFKIGVQMRDTLTDAKLEPAHRDQRIAGLAEEARKPIDAAIRRAELRRRLDERLYRLTTGTATQPAPSEISVTNRGIRVTVLATGIDEKTLTALKNAGFTVEATAETLKLVVGFAPRERLAEIAMLDGVRKIEPTVVSE